MKKTMVTVCMMAALASCSTGRKAVSLSELNGEWNIVSINGESVKTADGENTPFIGFNTNESLVYGSTGCNRLTGMLKANVAKGEIDFGALGSTRMMCPDMQTEQQVLGALGQVRTFSMPKGGLLQFADNDGKTLMELKKK